MPGIDRTAPIIPNWGAADIVLGTPIPSLRKEYPGVFVEEQHFDARSHPAGFVYRSPSVDIYPSFDGMLVEQIVLHGRYEGSLGHGLGLGSSIEDFERYFGPCGEDDEDNLVIPGVPGLCFFVGATHTHPRWRFTPVTRMCVFDERIMSPPSEYARRKRLRRRIQNFLDGADRSEAHLTSILRDAEESSDEMMYLNFRNLIDDHFPWPGEMPLLYEDALVEQLKRFVVKHLVPKACDKWGCRSSNPRWPS